MRQDAAALVLASSSAAWLRALRDAGIDGDPTNVLGLSLPLLRRMLAGIGVAITDLWRKPAPAGPAAPG